MTAYYTVMSHYRVMYLIRMECLNVLLGGGGGEKLGLLNGNTKEITNSKIFQLIHIFENTKYISPFIPRYKTTSCFIPTVYIYI